MTDRFIREAECEHISGLSRTTRWRLERQDLFPKRRKISPNAVAWLESEVLAWLEERATSESSVSAVTSVDLSDVALRS